MNKKNILIIGLGRMGGGIARRLASKGIEIFVYSRNYEKAFEIKKFGKKVNVLKDVSEFSSISGKKIIWVMLPDGDVTQEYLDKSFQILSKGDILIDGGNSKWSISQQNHEKFKEKGINFLDVGISGGIWGEEKGYSIMVGGDYKSFKDCEIYFKVLSWEDGYLYCGESGSGHFIKMVHNAIEYAIMQSYAEGFELIESFKGIKAKKSEIADLWNKGSVIRSWMLALVSNALKKDDNLTDLKAYVEDSGEGRWAIEYAISKAIPCEAITSSLFRRFRSRKDSPFSEKLLAALREQFGGHRTYKR